MLWELSCEKTPDPILAAMTEKILPDSCEYEFVCIRGAFEYLREAEEAAKRDKAAQLKASNAGRERRVGTDLFKLRPDESIACPSPHYDSFSWRYALTAIFILAACTAINLKYWENSAPLFHCGLGTMSFLVWIYLSSVRNRTSSSPWDDMERKVEELNQNSDGSVSYKLLYLVRHGMGVHNKAMKILEETGRKEEWNNTYARMDGAEIDGVNMVWNNSELVEEGVAQAARLSEIWSETTGPPIPQAIYTSSLHRCLQTTNLVYANILEKKPSLRPKIRDDLRERLNGHTCNSRDLKFKLTKEEKDKNMDFEGWIREHYARYDMDTDFEDYNGEDTVFEKIQDETEGRIAGRAQRMLDAVFKVNPSSHIISLTTHSYMISGILRAIGAPNLRTNEGVILPLLVKATKLSDNSSESDTVETVE